MTVSNNSLVWRDNALLYRGREVARLVNDSVYEGMWRVRLAEGRLSDMVNPARARDAARALALSVLNAAAIGEEAA